MSNQHAFKKLLQPFADDYANLEHRIRERVAGMDRGALVALESAAKKPTATNVWWATYRVAPMVRDAVREQLHYMDNFGAVPSGAEHSGEERGR